MKHCIIVKWNGLAKDKSDLADRALLLFRGLLETDGFRDTEVLRNCTDRSNRYDIMIVIDMDKEKLEWYDKSEIHRAWLSGFSAYIESKAIFDYE